LVIESPWFVLLALIRVLSRVPLRWMHRVGIVVGWCVYGFSASYAKRMKTNLTASGVCRDSASSRRLLRAAIVANGQALLELAAVWFRDDEAAARLVVECRGWDNIEAARRRGQSIIFLSPHMGCFEIAARYVGTHFPLTVMYRPQRAKWLNSLMERGRTNKQIELAPTNFKGVRMLAKALRRGESVGLLPDHAPGIGEGVWANFFDKPAFTMTLPRKLQRASGAAFMMTFGERLPGGKGFRLHFEPLSTREFNEEKLNLAIESLVRRYPKQYYWNYNRYKKGSSRRQRGTYESRRPAKPRRDCERRRRFHVWQSRQKRCLSENREFSAIRTGTWNGFVRLSEWNDELKTAFAAPGRLLARADIVKDSQTTTVGRAVFGARELFVKRYNYRGAAYAVKDLFRSSRAKRGWKAANNCYMRGIDVALPVAYLERRRWRVLRESYVVTAAVSGVELSRLLARRGGNLRFKRELIAQLARRLRFIHDRGLAPRDLKAANFIAEEGDPGRCKFSIVDFDGIVSKPVSSRVRAKNLARLVRGAAVNVPITSTDRLRFVKNYLGPGQFSLRRKMYRAVTKFAAKV